MTRISGDGTAAAGSDTRSAGAQLAAIPGHDMTASGSSDGDTLLPAPVARAVSFATRSTGLAIRMGSSIGNYGIDVAKFTTLSSFELGRSMLEAILYRAGRDALSRSDSDLARADAESILEAAVATLHRAMGHIVFWTAAGFNATSATLSAMSETSQLLLSMLDQFFGSTDSSRAMASIIAMIRREFENPATGGQGETVSVLDLVIGLCSIAYLQRSCRSLLQEEVRTSCTEETVWDVVVLSDGVRADVHGDAHPQALPPPGPTFSAAHHVQRGHSNQDSVNVPASQLQREIMRCLPDDAQVSITREITTSEIITVEITGGQRQVTVAPPPGFELIEESWDNGQTASQSRMRLGDSNDSSLPRSRLVFRHNRRQLTRASLQRLEGDIGYVEFDMDSAESSASEGENTVPPAQPHSSNCGESYPVQPGLSASDALTSQVQSPMSSGVPLMPKPRGEDFAAQKASRETPASSPSTPGTQSTASSPTLSMAPFLRSKCEPDAVSAPSKKGKFRNVLKKPISFFNKDDSGSEAAAGKTESKRTPRGPSTTRVGAAMQRERADFTNTTREPLLMPSNPPSPPNGTCHEVRKQPKRTPSSASFLSVHESLSESMISLTETYSYGGAGEHRRISVFGEGAMASPAIKKVSSDKEIHNQLGPPPRHHRRSKSKTYAPSIYTLRANGSETSLVPYHTCTQRSAFSGIEALGTLKQAGVVDGMFPKHHLLRNITRYMRFASASYGSKFLKVLGIATEMPIPRVLEDTHHELRSFAHHTRSDPSSILLSSFIDPQGGSDGTGSTNTGVPLVHYISLDHESKAVVLTCRGTLGFEDVLTDMTCEYDDLVWRGKPYKVHKGVHASAKRLLYGGDGRVLYILKTALEEFPDYGLVLIGHSLGAAVTALLGVMLSEPSPYPQTSYFVTASSEPHTNLALPSTSNVASPPPPPHICLPPNRPIHVYAYGPPATMSRALGAATRGLITTVVHGNDLVPYLSLGVLHDFQAVALALKTDNSAAKTDLRQRVWSAIKGGLARTWNRAAGPEGEADPDPDSWLLQDKQGKKEGEEGEEERNEGNEGEYWAYAALKVLRSSMLSEKLVPPGEVFVVESGRALRRDAFLAAAEADQHRSLGLGLGLGRPAHRIVLKYVRDVESRFGEVRFGVSMLTDHSPGKYEAALERLMVGVVGRS